MKFVSTRIITADVNRLVDFYEMVTEVSAVGGNELFAEIPPPIGTLAIGSDKTVPLLGDGSAEPAANRSAIVEFIVEDVDAEYERLREHLAEVVVVSRQPHSTLLAGAWAGAAARHPARRRDARPVVRRSRHRPP